MKPYDLAFSLGFSCGASTALRAAGLQHESYPLDWIGSPGIVPSAKMIAANFDGWFEKEDLRLYDIRRGGFDKHVYLNARTQFGFPHDFSSFIGFDAAYPEIREKYERRAARFLARAEAARRMLAVFVEFPVKTRAPAGELEEARRVLKERFPQAEIDLLYFHEDPTAPKPRAESAGESITAVALDYRQMERGEVMHTLRHEGIARYLRENVAVNDTRTEAEKRAYAERKTARRDARWGRGPFVTRLLNRWSYRLYRKLEKRLVDQGLVPWEGPLWFVRFDK